MSFRITRMLVFLLFASLTVSLSAFKAYWNFPSKVCQRNSTTRVNFSDYGIVTNKDYEFYGDSISIFYEFSFGKYPYYKDYNANFPINGGLPQNCSIEEHLQVAEKNITNRTTEYFNGLGIIDFEEWRPLWDQNGYAKKKVFQNESKRLIREQTPSLPEEEIQTKAELAFNNSARTIEEAKRLRPGAKWGFYGFPYCNYNAGKNHTYYCSNSYKKWNDRMMFLFNASTALYPSVYLNPSLNMTSEEKIRYAHAIVSEARRISKEFKPPLPIYVYIKIEYNPLKELDSFYDKSDLCASITQVANMGVDGIIIWSSSHNMTKRCSYIKERMDTEIGNLVKTTIEQHESCRKTRCNSHGRCVLSHNTTCTSLPFHLEPEQCSCECDYGYTGEFCSDEVVTSTPSLASREASESLHLISSHAVNLNLRQ